MTITKWDPFGDLLDLNRQITKFFGQGHPRELGNWIPAVDISERDNRLVVKAELAGVSPEDVDVTIDNGLLTIKGEKRFKEEAKDEKFYKVEQRYGSFQRTVSLPRDALSDNATAKFDAGILEVSVPRKEKPQPERIQIKTVDK